jgi:cytoskeletal protein CcmA (bactofilin family)
MESRRPQTEAVAANRATIGPSITIKGEVSGNEDLLIQGRVEGSIDLKERAVTVGPDGKVNADIDGRVVTVEGKVEGNLQALEQVILKSSARVQGDIKAPRVVLEDGATFRGMVDMGDPSQEEGTRGGQPSGGKSGQSAGAPGTDEKKSGSPSPATSASESKGGGPDAGDAAGSDSAGKTKS